MRRGKTKGASQQHFSLFSRVWVTTPYGGLQEMNGVNPNQRYMYRYAPAVPLALLGPPLRYGRSRPAQYEFETYPTAPWAEEGITWHTHKPERPDHSMNTTQPPDRRTLFTTETWDFHALSHPFVTAYYK